MFLNLNPSKWDHNSRSRETYCKCNQQRHAKLLAPLYSSWLWNRTRSHFAEDFSALTKTKRTCMLNIYLWQEIQLCSFYALIQTNPDFHTIRKMKNMCPCWLDTHTQRKKKGNSSVYCNVTLLIETPKNYIMPTILTQNYKVYPRLQQNVTNTSSKRFRTNSERKRETHPRWNTHTQVILQTEWLLWEETKKQLKKGVQLEALGRLLENNKTPIKRRKT